MRVVGGAADGEMDEEGLSEGDADGEMDEEGERLGDTDGLMDGDTDVDGESEGDAEMLGDIEGDSDGLTDEEPTGADSWISKALPLFLRIISTATSVSFLLIGY